MKDYLNYLQTIPDKDICNFNQEWSDEYFGNQQYKEYKETWC